MKCLYPLADTAQCERADGRHDTERVFIDERVPDLPSSPLPGDHPGAVQSGEVL